MARIGRPQEQFLTLSDIERGELDRLVRSQSASHSHVRWAQLSSHPQRARPTRRSRAVSEFPTRRSATGTRSGLRRA